jgi:hypothetical protein
MSQTTVGHSGSASPLDTLFIACTFAIICAISAEVILADLAAGTIGSTETIANFASSIVADLTAATFGGIVARRTEVIFADLAATTIAGADTIADFA